MRILGCLLLAASVSLGQGTSRHGVTVDVMTYPQASAKDALASVLKALDAKKLDYVVAQLADPGFVDDRVKRIYAGRFEEQVQDTQARLDPATVKLLRRFQKDGKWAMTKDEAVVTLDDVKDRSVRFVRQGDRWFLRHENTPDK